MSTASVHVGDIGTELIFDTHSDISAATLAALLVQKPDGTQEQWVGSVHETTNVRYVTVDGNWDEAGDYLIHAYVEIGINEKFHGNLAQVSVRNLFE